MPRGQLIKTAQFPYHVTNRANNQESFQLPLVEVYQNPARAGAVLTCGQWPFSTLRYLRFNQPFPIPISSPIIFDEKDNRAWEWLNLPHAAEAQDAIRRGLGHKNFKISSVGPRTIPVIDASI